MQTASSPGIQNFNEAFLRAIVDNSFDFLAVVRQDDRSIVFVNKTGCRMFEYESADELINVYIPSLRKTPVTQEYIRELDKEIDLKGFVSVETEYRTKTGSSFWGRMELSPFAANDEKYLLVQIEKIDRARAAEESLLLEQARFATLMQQASLGVIIVNEQHMIEMVNPWLCSLFGYESRELLGTEITKLIPYRFRDKHALYQRLYNADPKSRAMGLNLDIFGLRKDNSEFPVEISLANFRHNQRSLTLAFINDITERKNAEELRKLNEYRIRMLIENTPAAVAMFDDQMRYIIVSKRWMKDYRLGERDITGLSHYEVFPEIGERWRIMHKRALNGEKFSSDEEAFPRADGTVDWIKWEMFPWYNLSGKIGGIILFTEVITRKKQAELALSHLNAELERKVEDKTNELRSALEREKQLNELKSRFVATASHEFRTPLSTILSSAFLIEKYTKTEDQPRRLKHINRISSSVSILTDILNDFLSVGKIEEGRVTPKYVLFNIREQIEEVIEDLNLIKKEGQQILYGHQGDALVELDPTIIKHIVINLLSNAIKFSPTDSIIDISTQRDDLQLSLAVKDNGMGIPKDDQAHLFERFFRGANASAIQGTGLGLHIVKKYIELLNGTISFKSDLKKGTTFVACFKLHEH